MAERGEIRSLTGLRGVAALVVVAVHYFPGVTGPGYLMVDLFFLLSGFLMARTYGPDFQLGFTWQKYGGFLRKRIARVYPLYFIVSITVFVLTKRHIMASAPYPTWALISNVSMSQNLGAGLMTQKMATYLIPPGWSISTEFGAYLAFPILAGVAVFRSRRIAVAVLACAGIAIAVLSALPHAWMHQRYTDPTWHALDISSGLTLWPLARCLVEFTAGLAIYRLVSESYRSYGLLADVAILASIAVLWMMPGSDAGIVVMFALLVAHLFADTSPLARILGGRPAYLLGEWSYALYLLHWPLMNLGPLIQARVGSRPAAYSILAVLCLMLAALSYGFVEKPARRWLRASSNRPGLPMALEPSAP